MIVGSTTSTAQAEADKSRTATGTGSVDYQAFLKLLVAQLRNQDPIKPMESDEFMAQLANFSAVEQAIATNERLDQLLASSRLGESAALVGRTLYSADGAAGSVIRSVEFTDQGPVAWLDDGRREPIGPGIRIG